MISRKYSRKIQIFKTDTIPDGYGGNIVEDILIGSFWAEIKQNSSFKDTSLGMASFQKTYSFKIRTNKNLDNDIDNLSIIYQNMKFNVTDIQYNDELFREVNIIANV